ncbi:hypothetical protein MKEN_01381500 [Mycena kentingensis (nom. inval.)]|nr:hypothetical protein MKEN_01381500 [Mycena kentingensis (nom. inval.)]
MLTTFDDIVDTVEWMSTDMAKASKQKELLEAWALDASTLALPKEQELKKEIVVKSARIRALKAERDAYAAEAELASDLLSMLDIAETKMHILRDEKAAMRNLLPNIPYRRVVKPTDPPAVCSHSLLARAVQERTAVNRPVSFEGLRPVALDHDYDPVRLDTIIEFSDLFDPAPMVIAGGLVVDCNATRTAHILHIPTASNGLWRRWGTLPTRRRSAFLSTPNDIRSPVLQTSTRRASRCRKTRPANRCIRPWAWVPAWPTTANNKRLGVDKAVSVKARG